MVVLFVALKTPGLATILWRSSAGTLFPLHWFLPHHPSEWSTSQSHALPLATHCQEPSQVVSGVTFPYLFKCCSNTLYLRWSWQTENLCYNYVLNNIISDPRYRNLSTCFSRLPYTLMSHVMSFITILWVSSTLINSLCLSAPSKRQGLADLQLLFTVSPWVTSALYFITINIFYPPK